MIHCKWYKGSEELSVLDREILEEDRISWHLVVEDNGEKVGTCSLSPFNDSFCIRDVKGSGQTVELMLRMIGAKLYSLGKEVVYVKSDCGIKGFGFEPWKDEVLRAKKLVLPIYCKG